METQKSVREAADAIRKTVSLDELRASVGKPPSFSHWLLIDQTMIDTFARVTGDDSFIHIDPERARRTRFKGTIAHGLLTLSLLPQLMWAATPNIEGTKMAVNYGYDRVRFLAPVPVNSRIRARMMLTELEEPKPGFIRLTYDTAIEIEGTDQLALAAIWVMGRWVSNVSDAKDLESGR